MHRKNTEKMHEENFSCSVESHRKVFLVLFSSLQHRLNQLLNSLSQFLGFLVCICQGGSLYAVIELGLGLCSGRAHAQPCLILQVLVEHVGGRKAGRLYLSGSHVADGICLVISHRDNLASCKFSRSVVSEILHNLLNLLQSLDTL